MTALSTDPAGFVPSWLKQDDPASPRFFIRAAGVIERELMEAELAGAYSAGRVYDFQLAAAINEGIATLMAGDPGRDTLLALVAAEAGGEELAPPDRQMLVQVRGLLADHWPDYRALVLQMARRNHIGPLIAFRRFCTGWENVTSARGKPAVFAKGGDGLVTEDACGAIDPPLLKAAGGRAYDLAYAGALAKNSDAPSKSGDAPPTSSSGASSKGAGKSLARNGRKTPV